MKCLLSYAAIVALVVSGCMKPAPSTPAPAPVETTAPVTTEPASKEDAVTAPAEPAPAPSEGGAAAAQPAANSKVDLKVLSFDEIQALVASKKGKVVVMDAWSTSCEPCLKEFPHLVALSKKHDANNLACISLSFDYEGIGKPDDAEIKQPVIDFLNQQNATFDNVMSNEESDVLYKKFDLGSVPAVFVYDQNGNLAKRFDNQKAKKKEDAFTYAQIEALVDELLVKGPAAAPAPAEEEKAQP